MPDPFVAKVRVRYKETDQMGVVHHTNYFVYCELARAEYFLHLGYPYSRIESEGVALAVIECGARYLSPAHFEENLEVGVKMTEHSAVKVRFEYEIKRDGKLLCSAYTLHASIDMNGRAKRMPPSIVEFISKHVSS